MSASDPSTSTVTFQSGIYQIRHLASGKVYIGSAISFRDRWGDHRRDLFRRTHCNQKLQRAWNKYGAAAFVFEVVEIVPDEADLIRVEQQWLDWLKSYRRKTGFNICKTAGSTLGTKRSAKTRKRMSAAQKGREFSPEHIANLSAAHTGKRQTAETIGRRVAHIKGKPLEPEHREKLRQAKLGEPRPPEYRKKISDKLKGRKLSDEHRAAISAGSKGRTYPPEVRARMAEAALKREAAKRAKRQEAAISQSVLPFPEPD